MPEETRFRDLKQQMLLMVGVYWILAVIGTVAVFVGPNPLTLSLPVALIVIVAAISGLVILIGVYRGAAWSRTPLLVLCFATLPLCPLNLMSIGILRLLLYGPPPLPLTPAYHRRHIANAPAPRTSLVTWFCLLGIVFIILAAWFISRLPPELRRP
jgi:hypothetical protein